ncbi:hypothetical protein N9U87_02645, partial [bacterium]|nr:hypothetical protein [bacterium]
MNAVLFVVILFCVIGLKSKSLHLSSLRAKQINPLPCLAIKLIISGVTCSAAQIRSPPCTEKIISSGIKKIVIGIVDPNPLVSGQGIK